MTELGRFVDTFANTKPRLRRRLGTISSVQGATQTITVTIAGGSTTISGVRYFGHYPPVAGKQVWLDTDGVDLIAVGALAGLGGVAIAARVSKGADQALNTSGTVEQVTLSAVHTDPAGMFDDPNDQLVIPVTGIYQLSAGINWKASADSTARYLQIRINGSTLAIVDRAPQNNSAGTQLIQQASGIYKCDAADTVQLWAAQYTGAGQTGAVQGSTLTYLSAAYIGPAS